ncbi:MAG: hypothetical protein WCO98_11445 [bacterium]
MVSTENKLNRKAVGNSIVWAVFVLGTLFFLYSPGGYLEQQKAIESVSKKTFTLSLSKGSESFSLEHLIQNYDFESQTMTYGGFARSANEYTPLPWTTQYIGGKFVVGCQYNGHMFSFETDTMDVTPISADAKMIFGLQNTRFIEPTAQKRLQ